MRPCSPASSFLTEPLVAKPRKLAFFPQPSTSHQYHHNLRTRTRKSYQLEPEIAHAIALLAALPPSYRSVFFLAVNMDSTSTSLASHVCGDTSLQLCYAFRTWWFLSSFCDHNVTLFSEIQNSFPSLQLVQIVFRSPHFAAYPPVATLCQTLLDFQMCDTYAISRTAQYCVRPQTPAFLIFYILTNELLSTLHCRSSHVQICKPKESWFQIPWFQLTNKNTNILHTIWSDY